MARGLAALMIHSERDSLIRISPVADCHNLNLIRSKRNRNEDAIISNPKFIALAINQPLSKPQGISFAFINLIENSMPDFFGKFP